MTQEEKELLLKDLCARLPYGVKFYYKKRLDTQFDEDVKEVMTGTDIKQFCCSTDELEDISLERIKLFLRPMSSMTEEEEWKYNYIKENHTKWEAYDYLNSIHIDYRGLIPIGLALEAPEDMYTL